MLTLFETIVIYSVFLILVGAIIFKRVKELWNSVTMAKAYHLDKKLPSQEQVNRALEAFKKAYQKKLKTNKMNSKNNDDEEIDENDPSYGDMMFQ
jgi:hypothetical protein